MCAKTSSSGRGLKARDKALDELNAQVSRPLIERMAQDPDQLRGYLNLMFIARHLERVGDHATNIAEDAVFAAAAEDIRHQNRGAGEKQPPVSLCDFFLRHGAADCRIGRPGRWAPLTKAGRKEMHAVGEFAADRKVKVDCVLTSPLPRAEQTADIIAEHLKVVVRQERLLTPGFRAEDLARVLRKHPGDALMLVGHEPDFSKVIKSLTGEKSSCQSGPGPGGLRQEKGKLLWLVPPKLTAK